MAPQRRALLSVTNKEGIVDFARGLVGLGFEIVSTGGTARAIREAGVAVTEVSAVTGFPEILDGRVKSLHPKIHGGILARRDIEEHSAQLAAHAIAPIDLVVVNLYAFEALASRPEATFEDVIEEIDIGGPALLRAAAKNHAHVAPVVDPQDYDGVLRALATGGVGREERRRLAGKVFEHTARYDRAISAYFEQRQDGRSAFPDTLSLEMRKVQDLRYGENPHQQAAFYCEPDAPAGTLPRGDQLGGKTLSYNNLLDADSAWNLALDLGPLAAVFVKHNNPCGAARHAVLADAVAEARSVDPVSAFGGIVAVTRPVDAAAASILSETFLEVVVAPSFDPAAIELLAKKKGLRLLAMGEIRAPSIGTREIRAVSGGYLVQTRDARPDPEREFLDAKVVTKRAPTEAERDALAFNWLVAKHVRSNAIVFGHAHRVVAVGAGQMSRVDSVKICRLKAGEALRGTAVASDAFFPFRDGVDGLAEAGATAIIQPGGSVRDDEVIRAADEHGLAMLMTGVRHFRH